MSTGFNSLFAGAPGSLYPAPGGSVNVGLDTVNGAPYFTSANTTGWQPMSSALSKVGLTAQAANNANVVTYPVAVNGQYEVLLYEVSTNTPTGATLPAVTVTYTDKDSNTSVTQTLASVSSVSAAGVVSQGQFVIHPKVGTNVVIATTSYAAGSGTALQYAIHTRVNYAG